MTRRNLELLRDLFLIKLRDKHNIRNLFFLPHFVGFELLIQIEDMKLHYVHIPHDIFLVFCTMRILGGRVWPELCAVKNSRFQNLVFFKLFYCFSYDVAVDQIGSFLGSSKRLWPEEKTHGFVPVNVPVDPRRLNCKIVVLVCNKEKELEGD